MLGEIQLATPCPAQRSTLVTSVFETQQPVPPFFCFGESIKVTRPQLDKAPLLQIHGVHAQHAREYNTQRPIPAKHQSNNTGRTQSPPARHIHGIHQMYMRPRFSWSVASLIRRAAWPSAMITALPNMVQHLPWKAPNNGDHISPYTYPRCSCSNAPRQTAPSPPLLHIHGIHQIHMRPKFSWSVASSIRRAAWPSQLSGSEGVDSTPSSVPDRRPSITCSASLACKQQTQSTHENACQNAHATCCSTTPPTWLPRSSRGQHALKELQTSECYPVCCKNNRLIIGEQLAKRASSLDLELSAGINRPVGSPPPRQPGPQYRCPACRWSSQPVGRAGRSQHTS